MTRDETVLPLKDRIAAAVRGHYELLSTAHVRNVTVTTAHAEMIANRVLAVLGEQAKCTFPIAENQPCGKTPDAPVHHEPGIMRHDFRETEQAKDEAHANHTKPCCVYTQCGCLYMCHR